MITLIWAQGANGEIGINNHLPWHLPEDLKHFKETTMGAAVVMGRKTYESLGKPLPGRINIVLTSDPEPTWVPENVWVYNSVLRLINDLKAHKVFVIGGAEVFNSFMRFADRLIVTHINQKYIADTYAPKVDDQKWMLETSTPLTETATVKLYIKN